VLLQLDSKHAQRRSLLCTALQRMYSARPKLLRFTELRDCSFVGINAAWTAEILKLLDLRNSWRGRFGAYYCRVTIISAKS
jgi:hypothetical protein